MTITAAHPALADLAACLPAGGLVTDPAALVVYECDGFTIPRSVPLAVAFPESTEQLVGVVRALIRHDLEILPRGSGTGLAGGIVPVRAGGGVQVSTARMRKVLQVDLRNRAALVEAGCPNLALSEALRETAYHYAPDPSSQRASTIGGNVATNAGGIHTLKHGVTNNHILGVEAVTATGEVVTLGGPAGHTTGPDLVGLLCGSEGTLAIISKVWCRLTPKPTAFRTALAVFNSTTEACQTVADIIAAGIIPAALEMMDGTMINIVEDAFHFGFPTDAQAILLIEVDGPAIAGQAGGALDEELADIERLARHNNVRDFQGGSDPVRRAALWAARKKAFGAVGRVSPSYCTQDACVPRSLLPQVLERIGEICRGYGIRVTSVFHAGDGNVHPLLMYDEADAASVQRALDASFEILRYCVSVGGTITGEHGVGIEKLSCMADMYSPETLATMRRIRDALVPNDLLNPFKVLPREGVTISLTSPQRRAPH